MYLKEKFEKVFMSEHSITFQSEVRRKDHEWHNRITWKHIQPPTQDPYGRHITIKECEWFGFDDIEQCIDDCLKYIDNLKWKELTRKQ